MGDWKKKYEEITKRVKELHEFGNALTKLQMEVICPELKESEDERIMKRIRLCLDECVHSDIIRDYERDECLSYLEKQKEQKPLSTEETELNSVAFLEQLGYTCVPPGAEQKPTNSKPKEWSEEDEKMLRTIISDGSRCVELDSKQIAWLKSLRPQPHWKPSEEQMEALETIINSTHNPSHDICILRELYNDLKKL